MENEEVGGVVELRFVAGAIDPWWCLVGLVAPMVVGGRWCAMHEIAIDHGPELVAALARDGGEEEGLLGRQLKGVIEFVEALDEV